MLDTLLNEVSDQPDTKTIYDFDLVVLGSGPGGQRAAIQAAKLGKHVAIVEQRALVGGVCINTGTIPSKTFREAALHLSGFRERGVYGASYNRPMPKSSFGSIRLCFQAADDDESGDFVITLMDQGNGKGLVGLNNEHGSGSGACGLFRRSGSEQGAH